ncbi:MAG: hypothetical protein JWM87_1122 [Candidatus Eremiobacteraeota bacterium]|nr:hypothetical protein [Candidatus Eremiobacteraeota bacterium]
MDQSSLPGEVIGDATMIARDPSAPAAPVERGLVVMSIGHGSYVGLDEIGADIWRRLEQPRAFGELVDGLAADYDAPRAAIATDVRAWLVRMAEGAIIRLT